MPQHRNAKSYRPRVGRCYRKGTCTLPGMDAQMDFNNAALRKTGDAYANKVYTDNGGTAMTVFEGTLTDAQVDDVIAFLANPPKEEVASTDNQGTGLENNKAKEDEGNGGWIALIIIGILLVITIVLRTVRKSLLTVVNEKKGIPATVEQSMWNDVKLWVRTHKM